MCPNHRHHIFIAGYRSGGIWSRKWPEGGAICQGNGTPAVGRKLRSGDHNACVVRRLNSDRQPNVGCEAR